MAVIMLVEDVLELRDLISNRLLALGHTVVTAESLIGAQEALLEHRFEFGCLILDLCFPRVDGDTADETMGAILRRWVRERCPELPIIVNTALGSDHTLAVETFRDGATDFIKKSLSSDPRESLVVAVDRALEIRARRRAASPAPGSSEARRYTDHRLLLLGDRSGRRLFAAALNERRFAFQRLHFTILWTLAQGLRSGGEGWIHSQALDTQHYSSAISKLRRVLRERPFQVEDLIEGQGGTYRLTCPPENVTDGAQLPENLRLWFGELVRAAQGSIYFPRRRQREG